MALDSALSSLPFSPLRSSPRHHLPPRTSLSRIVSSHGGSSASHQSFAPRTVVSHPLSAYRISAPPLLGETDTSDCAISLPWTQLAGRLLPVPVQDASSDEVIDDVDIDPSRPQWISVWSVYNLRDASATEDDSLLVVDKNYFRNFYALSAPAPAVEAMKQQEDPEKKDFHINIGYAIRTLREELPCMFYKELSYDIYREDIVIRDPLNMVRGINNYKLIFRALRFHGRMFFKALWVDIRRIWQPSDNVIMVRWQVRGIPRVPWEAQGIFDGTSEYKLDKEGKIYEHKVDNVAPTARPKFKMPTVAELLNVQPCPSTPKATFFEKVRDAFVVIMPYLLQFSWIRFYLALKGTIDLHQNPRMM